MKVDTHIDDTSGGKPSRFAPHGVHGLVDCHGVDATLLADETRLADLLSRAADAAGARVLSRHFHRFGVGPGDGVTGVVLLAESHISIHTWPEHGFAAVDLFLCGASDLDRALACLAADLRPARSSVQRIARGTAADAPPR